MNFATHDEAKLILVTAKLLKKSPAGYLCRTYFILRTLYEMGENYSIDIATLTKVLNEKEHVSVIIKMLGEEFERVWPIDESEEKENNNNFSLELLQRIYLLSVQGSVERLDNFLLKTGYRGHLLPSSQLLKSISA